MSAVRFVGRHERMTVHECGCRGGTGGRGENGGGGEGEKGHIYCTKSWSRRATGEEGRKQERFCRGVGGKGVMAAHGGWLTTGLGATH